MILLTVETARELTTISDDAMSWQRAIVQGNGRGKLQIGEVV